MRKSARDVAGIRKRPDASKAYAHDAVIVTAYDRAVPALLEQRALRHARAILKANTRALFERGEHTHVGSDLIEFRSRLIDVAQGILGGAAHPAGFGEHVHFIALSEEHDADSARIEEGHDTTGLRIGMSSSAQPRTNPVDRRIKRAARFGHGQGDASRHRRNLALGQKGRRTHAENRGRSALFLLVWPHTERGHTAHAKITGSGKR